MTTTTEGVQATYSYTGKLTITNHRATLVIDRTIPGQTGRVRVDAAVSEDGIAVVRESPLPDEAAR